MIRKEGDNSLVQAFQYGSTNARLMDTNYGFGYLKLFASTGGTTLAEYTEFTAAVPTWTKSYTYFGSSQLATITPNGSGGEYVEFNHPDRLGTRLVTNQQGGTAYEQVHLPFGTALNAESSITDNPRRFTSYDRSSATGLDYAINRTYDSKAGRFTQVDPIGMKAVDLNTPQSLNLYNYCGNDPVNYLDPTGLFFKKFIKWLGKNFKKIFAAVAVALAVVAVVVFPWSAPLTVKAILGLVSALASAISSVLDLAGFKTASRVFGFIAMVAGIAALGFEVKDAWSRFKELRSRVFSFDDPPFIGSFYVEVPISFADKVFRAVSNVSNQVSTALGLSNFALPFEAKSGVGGKNPYGPCDSFSGVNARYMYRNGGEGTWGKEVRGMLLAEYASPGGATAFGAHVRSYVRASVRNPGSAPAGIGTAVLNAGKSFLAQGGTRVAEGVNNAMNLGYRGGSGSGFTCRYDVQ